MKVLVTAASKHGTTTEIAERHRRRPPGRRPRGRRHRAGRRADHRRLRRRRRRLGRLRRPLARAGQGVRARATRSSSRPARCSCSRAARSVTRRGRSRIRPKVATIDDATMAIDHQVFAGRLVESDLGRLRAAGHQDGPRGLWRLPLVGRHHRLGEGDRELPEERADDALDRLIGLEGRTRVSRTGDP